MDRKGLPLEIVLGVGLVIVAAAVFLGASLMRTAGQAAPTSTPWPSTRPPATPTMPAMPTATAAQSSLAQATATPAPTAAVLRVAPDFTLQRADGSTFTLAAQLARGPVVLAFFQMSG